MQNATKRLAVIGLLFASCTADKGDGEVAAEGTTTEAAATALTKAITFDNGTLVEGLLPPSTASSVSLVSLDTEPFGPGDAALLSFDVAGLDAGQLVTHTLVQLEDADGYFEVEADAASASTDGGTVAAAHLQLAFTIDNGVCKSLCDTTYRIELMHAVKLKGGDVGKHARSTLTLDCRKRGDHDKCGKVNAADGGDSSVMPAVECPLGIWSVQLTGAGTCDSTEGKVSFEITRQGGALAATMTYVNVGGPDGCPGAAQPGIAITQEGDRLHFDATRDDNGCTKHELYDATLDAACSTMTQSGDGTTTGCADCSSANGNCFGCGTAECTFNYGAATFTREPASP